MKQTAVEFLIEQIKSKADKLPNNTKENRMAKGIYVDCLLMVKQAKEMESQQKDKFAIDFYNWICSEEAVDLIQDLQIVGELNKIVTTEELLEIFKNK